MIKLRPYQEKLIEDIRLEIKSGSRRVLAQLPTGGGKTAIASDMIRTAASRGFVCYFVCNRQELVDQTARALYSAGVGFSYIAAGYQTDWKQNVFICSIQTLHRRLTSLVKKPTMIYWDECRMIASKTCSNVFFNFESIYHIGLDATPCRLSGEPLGDYFQKMIHGPSVRELIDMGFLCDYKIFAPKVSDFSGVRTKMGDFDTKQVDEIVNQKKILGNAVREYKKHAMGKRNLVFCNSIIHSVNLCAEFISAGIRAESIDGKMNDLDRRGVLRRFANGETQVVTSVDLVTAGYDLPAIECVTLERPTQSVALAKQMIGRGLRPSPGKTHLIILDHVNMWHSHGTPDDEYDFTLDGTKRPKKKTETSVKQCEKCYFVFESFKKACPECGHEKKIVGRTKDIEHTDDELVEISKDQLKAKFRQEQGKAQTKEDLYNLGISRGYKEQNARRWADHVFKARQAKKLKGIV